MSRFVMSNFPARGGDVFLIDRDIIDAGGRIGLDVGRAGVSGEVTRRSILDSDGNAGKSSTRWAALFTYPLPASLHLVASFGSDFRKANGDRPVIATLGINLGLGAVMIAP